MLRKLRNFWSMLEWQFIWNHWHVGRKSVEDEDFGIFDEFLFIGPFQFHWYSSAIVVEE